MPQVVGLVAMAASAAVKAAGGNSLFSKSIQNESFRDSFSRLIPGIERNEIQNRLMAGFSPGKPLMK